MTAAPTAAADRAAMTHREVLEAMSGLLLGLFVAILSSTVVSAALPRIITDLGGGQSSYTWVITATLLALTVTTPVWGKLADLFDRKRLVQSALVIYTVGSIFAGLFSTDDAIAGEMIAAGETVGERFWRLPLDRAYDEGLKSPLADLRHHAKDMEDGDAPYAAAFLRHFTEDRPWVHLDIAGKELAGEDRPLGREGATAFGVQMLEEWVRTNGKSA